MIIGIIIYTDKLSIFEKRTDQVEKIFFFYQNRKRFSYKFPLPDNRLVNSIDDYFTHV